MFGSIFDLSRLTLAPSASSASGSGESSRNTDNGSAKSGTIYSTGSIQGGPDSEHSSRDGGSRIHMNIGRGSVWRSIFGEPSEESRQESTHSKETDISRNPETTDGASDGLNDAFWDPYELPPKKFEETFLRSGPFGGGWNRRVKDDVLGKNGPAQKPNDESRANKLGNIFRRSTAHPPEKAVIQARPPSVGGDSDGFGDDTEYSGQYRRRGEA